MLRGNGAPFCHAREITDHLLFNDEATAALFAAFLTRYNGPVFAAIHCIEFQCLSLFCQLAARPHKLCRTLAGKSRAPKSTPKDEGRGGGAVPVPCCVNLRG